MLYKCYLRTSIVYVPTVGKRGGAYTDIEPVAVVPVANSEGLRRAFLDTIARKNAAVPLQKGKWPRPVVLKYAGVKTWSAFARDASVWSLEEKDGTHQIIGYRKHSKGYWVEDPDQKIDFPLGTPVDDVIDRMIAILQHAASSRPPPARS
jgi:hypothetical protein